MSFNFDEFLKGVQTARATIPVYKVDNGPTIARLTIEHDALPVDAGDERESSGLSPRAEIAARIAALRAEMEASRVEFTLRTLGPEEYQEIQSNDALDIFDRVAAQSRAPEGEDAADYADLPNLTADQWRKIAVRIGASQWANLRLEADDLISHKAAVPDFSRSVSATLSRAGSSES